MKSALTAMVLAGAEFFSRSEELRGNLFVAGVVNEEIFEVVQNRIGMSLAKHINLSVEVRGYVKEDYFSDRIISIEDFKVIESLVE